MNPKKRRDCLDREGREGEDVMTNEHFFVRPGTGGGKGKGERTWSNLEGCKNDTPRYLTLYCLLRVARIWLFAVVREELIKESRA